MQYYTVNPHVPSLSWGRKHEEIAWKNYLQKAESCHHNLKCSLSGLVVNPDFPYLGASPDGFVSCSCCNEGVIEIKCPFKYHDDSPVSAGALHDKNYCLKKDENGDVHLSHTHQYYHQIQGQLAIYKHSYCDFICWTTCTVDLY